MPLLVPVSGQPQVDGQLLSPGVCGSQKDQAELDQLRVLAGWHPEMAPQTEIYTCPEELSRSS